MKIFFQWIFEFLDKSLLQKDVTNLLKKLGFDVFLFSESVVEISLTPNRLDCEFVFGIVRELNFFFQKKKIMKKKEKNLIRYR